MKNGLEFKAEVGDFENLMKNVEVSRSMTTVSGVESNDRLLKQKEKAKQAVRYKKKDAKRWKHVVKFANEHQTVVKEECDSFYNNNPEEFAKEKRKMGFYGFLCSVMAVICGLGVYDCIETGAVVSSLLAIPFAIAFLPIGLFTLIYLREWSSMGKNGPENERAKAWDFLSYFKKNENVKTLWFKNKYINTSAKDLCKKNFKKSKKECVAINNYMETKDWLEKWSRGDVNNLRWVEWKALYGITVKYKRFLTPVSIQEKQDELIMKSEHESAVVARN